MRLTIAGLVSVVAAVVLAVPLTAGAQQPTKIWRVGWLQPSPSPSPGHASFRQGMRELGYLEGQNVKFEDRFADGHFDRLPGLAADLARLNLDVIVAVATGAIRAASEATRAVPIVMAPACQISEVISLPNGSKSSRKLYRVPRGWGFSGTGPTPAPPRSWRLSREPPNASA